MPSSCSWLAWRQKGVFCFRKPGSFAHRPSQSPSLFSVTCAHLMVRLLVATKTPHFASP